MTHTDVYKIRNGSLIRNWAGAFLVGHGTNLTESGLLM